MPPPKRRGPQVEGLAGPSGPVPPGRTLDAESARRFMLAHHGLRQNLRASSPAAAVRELLQRARHIQLDPLDVIGTNADLVAMARIDGLAKGDVYRHLMPKHGFEHFAKERCILPAEAFAWYRARPAETTWWNLATRLERVTPEVIAAVLEAVRTHGPLTAAELEKHGGWGAVEALEWSGWKGTARAASMALEVLWTRCEVVVAGRVAGARGVKLWDVPERALGKHAAAAAGLKGGKAGKAKAAAAPRDEAAFARWALAERAQAAGLLARASGAWWSTLAAVRTGPLPDLMIEEGTLEAVAIEGVRGAYLAPRGLVDRVLGSAAGAGDAGADAAPEPHADGADDGRMRILGPLDAFLWDRKLVHQLFGFDYIWEVYKPAATRRWGYYVCPLLHRGALVGRFEGRVVPGAKGAGELAVVGLWPEAGQTFDRTAFKDALARHAAQLGVKPGRVPRA